LAENQLLQLWTRTNVDRKVRINTVDKESKLIAQLRWELQEVKKQRDSLLKLLGQVKKLLDLKLLVWYLCLMAKYRGRTVKLNKIQRGDVKKFKVFVKDRSSGRIKKVNFGSKTMSIKKHIPARKRSFMARFKPILAKVKGQKSLSPVYWAIKSWRWLIDGYTHFLVW